MQAIIPLKAIEQISLIILLFTSVPWLKETAYQNVLERNQMQVPGSTIFYVGIRVVSLRCKSYRTSLFQKVAFVNNNNNNNNNNFI